MTETRQHGLGQWLRKIFPANAELQAKELAAEATKAGASQLSCCRVRSRVVIRGIIASVLLNKHGGMGWLEAEVDDGTGTVRLIWMGRRSIAGVTPGRKVRVEGRLAKRGDDLVLYNPAYELLT